MKRTSAITLVFLFLVAVTVSKLSAQDIDPNSDAPLSSSASGYLVVQFQDPPIAVYAGGIPGHQATQPAPGSRLNLNSPAAQSYSAYLGQKRQQFKNWLNANFPAAQVMAEYEVVVNGVALNPNGATPAALMNGPNVLSVSPSYFYHPTMDVSIGLINAPTLWALEPGGSSNAGAGVKIGIIDAGVDQTHPFLTDSSLAVPSGFPKCDSRDSAVRMPDVQCLFTSHKVIVAKVFQTSTKFDAHAAQEHGTHVSGTAAGVSGTCAPFVGCTMSGVAPKAFLGNYNVFPGNIVSTPDYVIARAVETAVTDGMDVLNLSLGGGVAHRSDVSIVAVNNAVRAGVVVAIAAGNAGPGAGTVESPGVAANVITAGASTNPHFVGIPVTEASLGTIGAALGDFANFIPPITALFTTTTPANGCTAFSGSLAGEIALIARGTCSFSTKIRNAQTAGAVGVLISNNVLGDPTAMAQDGTPNQPTIPAAMVSETNGVALAGLAGSSVTVNGTTQQEFLTDGPSADLLASFSSRGPSPFTLSIKPDLTAPGVNVYSSIPAFGCASPPCYAFFQGTSMATPHTAGSAALLVQLHPTWSPAQIKSALVNTAHRPVKDPSSGAGLSNPMERGAGRIDLAAASATPLTFDPVSVSFGQFTGIPPVSFPQSVSVQNVSGNNQSCSVLTGSALVGVSPAALNVGGNGHATLTLTLNASGTAAGDYFGDVTITCGAAVLHVPWWVRIG